jgi:hypothetical protein
MLDSFPFPLGSDNSPQAFPGRSAASYVESWDFMTYYAHTSVPAIAFYYYGIPRCCGGLYGICIDCDPLNPNFIPIDAVNRTDDGKNPPVGSALLLTTTKLTSRR